MKHKVDCNLLGATFFSVLILYLSWSNYALFTEPFYQLINGELSFTETKDQIANNYISSLSQKYEFINLNGLFSKLSGRRICNNVMKLKNGMLIPTGYESCDVSSKANIVIELNKQLQDNQIHFYYVQSPAKVDIYNELVPYGAIYEANNNANNLVEMLEDNGVDVIDLRQEIADTPEHLNQYFYKTDHHWNPIGAFKGFQLISDRLQQDFPDDQVVGIYQDINNWDIHKKEHWFLGSQGKRTGTYFAGIDDLIWLTPKFDTEMSFLNVYKDEYIHGDYYDANIREQYINEKDYYQYNAYCVYIGGDYALVQHLNNDAPVDKKILIVKDSFVLPLESYFSTIYKEVDVIDMRHYLNGSLDEYILDSMPDIVLMSFTPGGITEDKLWGTGADALSLTECTLSRHILKNVNAFLSASDDCFNHAILSDDICAGRKYELKCDEVNVTSGNADGVSLKLINKDTQEIYYSCMWDLNYCKANDSFEWTFTAPDNINNLELIVYSGIAGTANDTSLEFVGIHLDEYQPNP